jgi:hypothetical protein
VRRHADAAGVSCAGCRAVTHCTRLLAAGRHPRGPEAHARPSTGAVFAGRAILDFTGTNFTSNKVKAVSAGRVSCARLLPAAEVWLRDAVARLGRSSPTRAALSEPLTASS